MAWQSPTFFSLSYRWSAASAEAIETTLGRQRRACSNASSMLPPAARLTTEKRSGKASTILRVLLPIEPVDPRMAMRFISGKDYGNPHRRVRAPALARTTEAKKNHDYLESVV